MVTITGKTTQPPCSAFERRRGNVARPRRDHVVTHPVGKAKEMHMHDPPLDHLIVMHSGRMRWTVDDRARAQPEA